MKQILSALLFLILAGSPLWGAGATVERIFVSTDRPVYISGDAVWCSLSILDGDGRFSNESAVSYLELISADGTVCTAKIGLLEGRGAGSFRIPASTPTGIYRLVAYTAVNAAEEGGPSLTGSRLLSIFNTTSAARVAGGVEIGKEVPTTLPPSLPAEGDLQLSTRTRLPRNTQSVLYLDNSGAAASVSLSVYHEDDLLPVDGNCTPEAFLRSIPTSVRLQRDVTPEFDGEVVTARVRGVDLQESDASALATLSSAGSPSNVYVGRSYGTDLIRFHTSNIYGDRELVCEVTRMDRKDGYIEFESPFVHPDPGSLPKLVLQPGQKEALTARKAALRAEKDLRLDTLATFMTHREDLLLSSVASHRYHLDDYTRFPSVREILVEILPELRLRTDKGDKSLVLTVSDAGNMHFDRTRNILVMMDGVILSDIDLLLDFDAMLLEDIDIYDQAFLVGRTPFNGIVNFITKNNYVTALHFPSNVRVVDFQGVSYPVAYRGAVPEGDGPDLRQLLFWHPLLKIEGGRGYRIEIHTPGYAGRFKAVAEGFTEDGKPVRQEVVFEVE